MSLVQIKDYTYMVIYNMQIIHNNIWLLIQIKV